MLNKDRVRQILTIGLLVIVGLLLINVGLVIGCINTKSKLNKAEAQIVELNDKYNTMSLNYEDERNERIRLQWINDDLWALYYSMVSTYDGEYECYE